jgi:release factor glutamine methyltransferase
MPQDPTWTIGRLIEWTRAYFQEKGIEQPRLEAEILLAHALGLERIQLYLKYEQEVDEETRGKFRDLVRRRAAREPAKYLVGMCEFMSLTFRVTGDCLIPRPETELLVEEVLALSGAKRGGKRPAEVPPPAEEPAAEGAETTQEKAVPQGEPAPAPAAVAPAAPVAAAPEGPSIIELCTGCGCIAVSLAAYLPSSRVVATDISPGALQIAGANAQAHGVDDRILYVEGDLFGPLDAGDVQPADFLVANPPYVAESEWDSLQPEIRDHEPRAALVSGPTGLEIIERIVKGAPAYLRPGGTLLVEIGAGQGPSVAERAAAVRGLEQVEIRKDYANHDRMLVAKKK